MRTMGTVAPTSINLRAKPDISATVIDVLSRGTKIEFMEDAAAPFVQVVLNADTDPEIGYLDGTNVTWDSVAPQPIAGSVQPGVASAAMLDLVNQYAAAVIDFPNLKAVTLAQWILESGWGTSELANRFNNFGGLKYRDELAGIATRVSYNASDGVDFYCAFKSRRDFIAGYWQFLRRPVYVGWDNHTLTSQDYINFIGPIYTPSQGYAQRVLANIGAAQRLLDAAGTVSQHEEHHGDGNPIKKPVAEPSRTICKGSRQDAAIDHIVIHYTESRSLDGTIATFTNDHLDHPRAAHYAIGRDGRIVQFVDDTLSAWHAGDRVMNHRSIGIEHSAAPGDQMTLPQQNISIQLIRWLVHEYDIPRDNIIPHSSVVNTDCPAQLLSAYDVDPKQAVRKWIQQNL